MASPWPARTNVPSDEQRAIVGFLYPPFHQPHVSRAASSHINPSQIHIRSQSRRIHMEMYDGAGEEVAKSDTDSRNEIGQWNIRWGSTMVQNRNR